MFNFITKLIASFALYKKYGWIIISVSVAIIFIILVTFIYSDVVTYLTNSNLNEYLIHALLTKWMLILLSIAIAIYTIYSKPKKPRGATTMIESSKNDLTVEVSDIEKIIRSKDILRSRADIELETLLKNKKNTCG